MADPLDPVEALRQIADHPSPDMPCSPTCANRLADIARAALAALPAPVPEGVPGDHRVCSHGIYHHGCPSCDRQDPEERL